MYSGIRKLYLLTCIFTFTLIQVSLASQKFGKVSKDELNMNSFTNDPDAKAVILFDIGELELMQKDRGFAYEMRRHVRIKVLTEEGKDYGNFKIPYYFKDKIVDIKGHTILPDGKKIKLKGNEVHEEKVDKYYNNKVFTFKGVEVGSVLEYQYTLSSEIVHFLEPWFFQNDIFTQLSQYSVKLYPGFNYNAFPKNIDENLLQPETEDFFILGKGNKQGKMFTWKLENVPALEQEAHMRALNDYRKALYFQIQEYQYGFQTVYKFIKSWDDLAKEMYEHYKPYLEHGGDLKDTTIKLISNHSAPFDKINAIYQYVRDEIETDWIYGKYVERDIKEILKNKKGSITEKNILMTSMLKHTGFEAYPLLISTRSHGKFVGECAQLQQFNLALVLVKMGNRIYLYDTAEKYCPPGMLPQYAIVEMGLLVDEMQGKLMRIPFPKNLDNKSITTMATLQEDGGLSCRTSFLFRGYEAVSKRHNFEDEDPEKYLKDWFSDRFANVEIDSFNISGQDNLDAPLILDVNYRVPDFAQIAGDKVYLSAPWFSSYSQNPFKKEKRIYPVEYNNLFSVEERVILTLPEEFSITEIPHGKRLDMKGVTFALSCMPSDNKLVYTRRFFLEKSTFETEEYEKLRNFYTDVQNSDQSQLVFSKIENIGE
jgi:hypothetical protein